MQTTYLLTYLHVLPEWVTVCGQANHLGAIYIGKQHHVNSAFHTSKVGKLNNGLLSWG